MGRTWPAWAGLWGTFGSAVLWGAAALEARDHLDGDGLPGPAEGYVVAPPEVMWLAVALGVLLPLLLVAVALTWRRPLVRVPLALAGAALLAAAWGWWRMPDVGWAYSAGSASAGLLALVGAALGTGPARDPSAPSPPGRAAGVVVAVVLGLPGAAALVVAVARLVDLGTVFRHEEDEIAWDLGTPAVALATALLSAATAAAGRRWALAAASLVTGLALGAWALLGGGWSR